MSIEIERIAFTVKQLDVHEHDNATVSVTFTCGDQAQAASLYKELNSEIKLGKLHLKFDIIKKEATSDGK